MCSRFFSFTENQSSKSIMKNTIGYRVLTTSSFTTEVKPEEVLINDCASPA